MCSYQQGNSPTTRENKMETTIITAPEIVLPAVGSWVRVEEQQYGISWAHHAVGMYLGHVTRNGDEIIMDVHKPDYNRFLSGPSVNFPSQGRTSLIRATRWTVVDDYAPPVPPTWEVLVGLSLANDKVYHDAHTAIETISEVLIEEAEKRGWCDEFDQLTDDVNGRLPSWLKLMKRSREYVVSWTETVTVQVRRSITVNSSSEECAEEDARESVGDAELYDIQEAIDCGNWESNSDWEDVDIELN
jgi:hypothetical protein